MSATALLLRAWRLGSLLAIALAAAASSGWTSLAPMPMEKAVARAGDSAAFTDDSLAPIYAEPTLFPVEHELHELLNRERTAQGVAPLTVDMPMLDAARLRARDQGRLPSLSHYDASGEVAIRVLLAAADVPYLLAGENLVRVVGAQSAVARAHDALMRSSGHRANILEPRYTAVAIGSANDESGRLIFAEVFRQEPN